MKEITKLVPNFIRRRTSLSDFTLCRAELLHTEESQLLRSTDLYRPHESGHSFGGFLMGDTESEEFRELLARWFQFGLFCPIMRLHGSRLRTKDQKERYPGIIERSGGPNEIWCFGETEQEAGNGIFIKLYKAAHG